MVAATNMDAIIQSAVVVGGIALMVAVIVTGVIIAMHVDNDHALIPWGHRKRVEKARAEKEIAEMRYNTELSELKHMALQPVRNRLLSNIDQDKLQPLKELLAGESADAGDKIREAAWGEKTY